VSVGLVMLSALAFTACDSGSGVDAAFQLSTPAPSNAIGNSALSISPVNYNFGLVAVGAVPGSITVVAKNISSVPIYITSFSGPVSTNFEIVSNTCPASTTPLIQNASCSLVVHFNPQVSGTLDYQLSTAFGTTSGDNSLNTNVTLSGIGVAQLSFPGLNPIDPTQVTTTTVPLTWPTVVGASTFAVYEAVSGQSFGAPISVAGSASGYVVGNLLPNTDYVFQVKVLNALGQADTNTVEQLATTNALGTFSAPPVLATSEGGSVTSGDIGQYCTDAEGHYPTFMAIASQSDPDSQCTLLTSPYRIQCQPNYKVGNAAWSSTLSLSCVLDAWPTAYTQSMSVNVAFTDRPPVMAVLGNQSVLAGTAITSVVPVASDPNLFALTYTCQYDNTVDAVVSSGAATCAGLLNQNGTGASFSTANGTFSWTPPLASSGTPFEIKITASDTYGFSASRIFTINVGEPPPDSSHSIVTLSSASINSGSAITVTLTAKDANGNSIPKGGSTVTFSASTGAGVSTGTFSAVTDNGDGTYTANFTGALAGTATTIHASAQGSPITTAAPTLTVNAGAISPVKSAITLSSASVASGATISVTLTAKDAAGNLISTGGSTVLFSRTGGTSTGSFSATTDNGNGTYGATFTGILSGTATSVGGTIGGTTITSTLPSVTVVPGTISLSQSTLTITGGVTVVASGSLVHLTLTSRDGNGNELTTGGQTVSVVYSGGTSTGSFGSTVDNGDGTYSSTFTGAASGTVTSLIAKIAGVSLTSTAPQISVTAGLPSLSQSLVTLGSNSIISGASTTVSLALYDGNNNPITTGGQTISFSSANGVSTGTFSSVTDNGNGTYSATFTGVKSGTATSIGALVGGAALTSTLPTLTVSPGSLSLSQSSVIASAASIASGASDGLTLQAKDAAGNNITTGGRVVVFTRNGGTSTGTISSTVDNANGTYTATFTGSVSGTATSISATVDGVALTSTAAFISVVPANLSYTQSSVSLSSSTLSSGGNITVILTAKDINGNAFPSGGLTITFGTSGGTSTGSFSSVIDNGNGTYSSTFTGSASGTPTNITATIGGTLITSAAPTAQVIPGSLSLSHSIVTLSAASVTSGSTITATLSAKDANGNSLGVGGQTVLFSDTVSAGTSTGAFSAVTDNGNGTYTSIFTAQASGTALAIGATIGGAAVTSASPTITVTSGALSLSQSLITVSSASLTAGASVTITLATKDAYGNSLGAAGAGQNVQFARSGGVSNGTFSVVTDLGNGNYAGTFTGTTAGTATTLIATIGGSSVSSALPTLTVSPGALSYSQTLVSVSSPTVSSGSTVTLTLTTKDAGGNNLGVGGQTVLFSKSGGVSNGTISVVTDNGNGTYSATFTATTSGTATSILATIGGTSVTSNPPTVTVSAGALSLSQSALTVSSSSVASGSSITLTLTAKDSNGNTLPTGGQTVLFSRSGGSSSGTISSTTDNNNGTYTASFTGTTSGSATTINATVGGVSLTSALPSVTVTPGIYSLAQSTATISSSSVSAGSTVTLTVTAKDANGNQLTSGGLTITFGQSGGTSAGTVSAITDNANGTYTAIFTASTSGTATTLAASIGGVALTSSAPTITVIAGMLSLAQSSISVSSPTVQSGGTVTLTFTSKDSSGNLISSGGQTVAFNRSGGTSAGTISATTDNANGTYTAVFTATTSGTSTSIGATVGGSFVTSASPTVTVNPGFLSLSQSVISVSSSTVVSGSSVTLTLTAKDSNGNPLTSGGQIVVFSRSGGTSSGSIFGGTTDNNNGTYTATFSGTTSGTPTSILATVGGSAVTSTSPTLTVTVGAFSLAQSLVTVSSASIQSGSTSTVTLTAKDGAGNTLTGGGIAVAFAKSGGTSNGTFAAVTDNGNGTYTSVFTGTTSGTSITISATMNSGAVATGLPTIIVGPGTLSLSQSTIAITGAPSFIVAGTTATLTLTSRDGAGNLITSGGQTVAFTASGGTSTGSFSSVTDNNNGTYTVTFTGAHVGTANAMSANVGATPVALTSTAPSLSVVAGAYSLAQSLVSLGASSVVSGGTTSLTLTAEDSSGNTLTSGGLTVLFNTSGGVSSGTIGSVTDHANGIYTATFTATTSGAATSITASIGGVAVTSTLPTLTVTTAGVSLAQSTVTVSTSSIVSGATSMITLTARDLSGNPESTGGLAVAFTTSGGTTTGTVGSVTDHANGTYTAVFTGNLAGTATTVNATIGGVSVTSTMPIITVNTASISLSQSTFTLSSSTFTAGGTATATLVLKDLNGNTITDSSQSANLTFTALATGSSRGSFNTITAVGGNPGSYQATFTATTAGTADTLQAALAGTGNFSTNPSFTVADSTVAIGSSTVVASTTSLTANGAATSTITVTLLDAYSNPISGKLVTLTSNRGANDTISPASASTLANGTAQFVVKSAVAGTSAYTATDSTDSLVVTQQATITYSPGTPSGTISTAVASPTTVVADNISTSTVTVTLLDNYSNPVPSKLVTLVSSRGASDTFTATATTGANGVATFSITSKLAGVAVFTATDTTDSVMLSQQPNITFNAGSAVSIAVVSGASQSGSNSTQLANPMIILATDQYANPVNNVAIAWTVTTSDTLGGSSTNTSANGQASNTLTFGATPDVAIVTATLPSGASVTFTEASQVILASNYVATQQSTTSTTFTNLATPDSVTVTVSTPTSVVIDYYSTLQNSSNVNSTSVVQVDGTALPNSQMTTSTYNAWQPHFMETVTTLSKGTHTITVQHETASGTSSWSTRLLTVSLATNLLASNFVATAQTISNGTTLDLATPDSVTFNIPTAAQVYVNYTATSTKSATGTNVNTVYVDGVAAQFYDTAVNSGSYMMQYSVNLISLSAGNHTIDVKHECNTATCTWSQRTVSVSYAAPLFLATNYVTTAETAASTSFADLATADSATFTLAATTNVIVQYMADVVEMSSPTGICESIVNVDGTNDPTSIAYITELQSWDGAGIAQYKVQLGAGSHTIKIQHANSAASMGCRWNARTLMIKQSP
jgi:adhesin/invasin